MIICPMVMIKVVKVAMKKICKMVSDSLEEINASDWFD